MKKLFIFILSIFIITGFGIAEADPVHIFCPEPSQVHFSVNNPTGSWDHYMANGFSKVIGNMASFMMTSTDSSNLQPTQMYGASYTWDGSFICNYVGGDLGGVHNTFPLVYGDLRPVFKKGCYFKGNHDTECSGNVQQCELICE